MSRLQSPDEENSEENSTVENFAQESMVSEKIKRLGKESLIYGLSRITGRFISIFFVPIYTRIFVPSDYGVVDLLTIYASIISIFILFGLDSAQSFFFYSTDDAKDKKYILSTSISFQIFISLIMFVTTFFFSSSISKIIFGNDNYSIYIRIIAIDFSFSTFTVFAQETMRMIRQPWKYLYFTIGSIIANIILTILLVVIFKKGIYGVFLSKLIVDVLFTFVAIYIVKSVIGIYFSLTHLKQLLSYGAPLLPAGIAYWVLNAANRYFLRYYFSLTDVGLYSIGNKIASLLGLITGAFQLSWGPFAFSIHRDKDSKQVYADVLTYYLAIVSGIGLGLSIFALEVLKIFTTSLYYGASTIVPYLVFSVMSLGVYYIVAIGVNITKKTSHIGWTIMVSAGVNIALNFVLIPRYGIIGASIASCVSTWLYPILLYFISQHYYPIDYKLDKTAIILSSSIILIIISNFIKVPNLLLAIALKFTLLIAYFLILMLTSIIQPGMLLRILKGLVNRKG